MRTERQQHGFLYEQDVMRRFNIIPSTEYTSEWDGFLNDIPVSIKVEKFGSDIELADYFRNSKKTTNFYLIVGFWEGEKSNIIEEHTLYINGQEWHELFNDEFTYKFRDLLDNITNSYKDDTKWKNSITALRKEWKDKTNNLIRPRFKRDHKSQKRIQCAINNKDFYTYFIPKYEIILIEEE